MRAASPLLITAPLLLQACYFSYNDGPGGHDDWDDWDTGWFDDDDDDSDADADSDADSDSGPTDPPTGEDPLPIEETLWFAPPTLVQGELQVIDLRADDPATLLDIVSIELWADLTVHVTELVGDEIRIAVSVDADADLGPGHAVIELADGTTALLRGAFEVVAPGGGEPACP